MLRQITQGRVHSGDSDVAQRHVLKAQAPPEERRLAIRSAFSEWRIDLQIVAVKFELVRPVAGVAPEIDVSGKPPEELLHEAGLTETVIREQNHDLGVVMLDDARPFCLETLQLPLATAED